MTVLNTLKNFSFAIPINDNVKRYLKNIQKNLTDDREKNLDILSQAMVELADKYRDNFVNNSDYEKKLFGLRGMSFSNLPDNIQKQYRQIFSDETNTIFKNLVDDMMKWTFNPKKATTNLEFILDYFKNVIDVIYSKVQLSYFKTLQDSVIYLETTKTEKPVLCLSSWVVRSYSIIFYIIHKRYTTISKQKAIYFLNKAISYDAMNYFYKIQKLNFCKTEEKLKKSLSEFYKSIYTLDGLAVYYAFLGDYYIQSNPELSYRLYIHSLNYRLNRNVFYKMSLFDSKYKFTKTTFKKYQPFEYLKSHNIIGIMYNKNILKLISIAKKYNLTDSMIIDLAFISQPSVKKYDVSEPFYNEIVNFEPLYLTSYKLLPSYDFDYIKVFSNKVKKDSNIDYDILYEYQNEEN